MSPLNQTREGSVERHVHVAAPNTFVWADVVAVDHDGLAVFQIFAVGTDVGNESSSSDFPNHRILSGFFWGGQSRYAQQQVL